MKCPNPSWAIAMATLAVTGCGNGVSSPPVPKKHDRISSPAVPEKQDPGQEVTRRFQEESLTLDAFESLLTDGTWYRTTGSGPFTEHYAFTFRADHSVGSRIYSDFTNRPVVRGWQVSPCDRSGRFALTYTQRQDAVPDNQCAFHMLASGSRLRYDSRSGRMDVVAPSSSAKVFGNGAVSSPVAVLNHANGSVFDDTWVPDANN